MAMDKITDIHEKVCENTLINLNDDPINPSHYKRYRLEMIDNMQNSMTHDEFIGYLKGNIMKYISRFQDKNGLTDIKKAQWYLKKLAEVVADGEDKI